MTDEANLLAAILARPDDDLSRLIYADWLAETPWMVSCERCSGDGKAHGADRPFEWSADVDYGKCVVCHGTGEASNGHVDRAEFIRVQVELAPYADVNLIAGGDLAVARRVDALRRRERELLFARRPQGINNGIIWLGFTPLTAQMKGEGPIPTVAIGLRSKTSLDAECVYRRGFVESIACSWSDFRTHAAAIRERTPLREVAFTSPSPDYRACGACKDCCDRLPKFCERERERLGLPTGITFHLPTGASVVANASVHIGTASYVGTATQDAGNRPLRTAGR